jgi:nucleoside-diphosphate-sugar epimerase
VKLLVTGAGGFVGRQLVPALAALGHEVVAATRSAAGNVDGVRYVVQPELDRETVDWDALTGGVDGIVHLAGIAHATGAVPDAAYMRVNHHATVALARAAERAGVSRFVFVSSIRAQSGSSHAGTLTELSQEQPTDAYGRSKLAAETALATTKLAYAILRPVLIYGPGVKGNLRQLARLAQLPIPLPFGAFENRRSFLGIENFASAVQHVLATSSIARETFVVADPTPLSLAELLAILRHGRRSGLLPIPPRLFRPIVLAIGGAAMWDRLAGELVVDPAKLIASGWTPRASRDGLERFATTLS